MSFNFIPVLFFLRPAVECAFLSHRNTRVFPVGVPQSANLFYALYKWHLTPSDVLIPTFFGETEYLLINNWRRLN